MKQDIQLQVFSGVKLSIRIIAFLVAGIILAIILSTHYSIAGWPFQLRYAGQITNKNGAFFELSKNNGSSKAIWYNDARFVICDNCKDTIVEKCRGNVCIAANVRDLANSQNVVIYGYQGPWGYFGAKKIKIIE